MQAQTVNPFGETKEAAVDTYPVADPNNWPITVERYAMPAAIPNAANGQGANANPNYLNAFAIAPGTVAERALFNGAPLALKRRVMWDMNAARGPNVPNGPLEVVPVLFRGAVRLCVHHDYDDLEDALDLSGIENLPEDFTEERALMTILKRLHRQAGKFKDQTQALKRKNKDAPEFGVDVTDALRDAQLLGFETNECCPDQKGVDQVRLSVEKRGLMLPFADVGLGPYMKDKDLWEKGATNFSDIADAAALAADNDVHATEATKKAVAEAAQGMLGRADAAARGTANPWNVTLVCIWRFMFSAVFALVFGLNMPLALLTAVKYICVLHDISARKGSSQRVALAYDVLLRRSAATVARPPNGPGAETYARMRAFFERVDLDILRRAEDAVRADLKSSAEKVASAEKKRQNERKAKEAADAAKRAADHRRGAAHDPHRNKKGKFGPGGKAAGGAPDGGKGPRTVYDEATGKFVQAWE